MSSVNEIAREQTAEKTAAGFKLTRVWLVELDSHLWGPYAAIQAVTADPDGADIGDAHPINPFVFLKRFPQPAGEENRKVWRVTGEYEQDVLAATENPLDAPSAVAWGSAAYTEPIVQDIDGNPIVNSAGQPFDPPLVHDRRALVATITYNIEVWNPTTSYYFQDAVNESAARIGNLNVDARMAKIVQIDSAPEYWKDTLYYAITVKIEIKAETWDDGQGWDRQVLDQGIYGLDSNDKFGRLITEKGEEATEPLLLDGTGHVLDPQTATPHYITFKANRLKDFSELRLETG